MVKNKINYQYNCYYKILAITTPLKDYRVSFLINNALNIKLQKKDALIVDNKKKQTSFAYDLLQFKNTINKENYYVIKNKLIGEFFLYSLKKFDYILLITSENKEIEIDEMYSQIKKIENFQIVFKVKSLKRQENKYIVENIINKEENE